MFKEPTKMELAGLFLFVGFVAYPAMRAVQVVTTKVVSFVGTKVGAANG